MHSLLEAAMPSRLLEKMKVREFARARRGEDGERKGEGLMVGVEKF